MDFFAPPLRLIDGPLDPVSGAHLAFGAEGDREDVWETREADDERLGVGAAFPAGGVAEETGTEEDAEGILGADVGESGPCEAGGRIRRLRQATQYFASLVDERARGEFDVNGSRDEFAYVRIAAQDWSVPLGEKK